MYDNFAATVCPAGEDHGPAEHEKCAKSRKDGLRDDSRTHAPRPKAEAKHGTGRGHIGQGTRTPRERDADTSGTGRGHLGQTSLLCVLRVVGLFYKKKCPSKILAFSKNIILRERRPFSQKKKK